MKKQIVLLLMLILPILSYGMDYDLSYFSWRNAEDCDNDGYAGYREMYFIISPSNALSLTNGEKIIVEYRKNGVFTSWNEYKTYYHYFFTSGEYHSFEGSLEIDDLEKDGYDFRISVYSQNMSNEWVWQVTFDGGDNANLDNKNFEPKNEDGLCACATPTNVSASDGTSASYVYVSWTGAYNNEEYVVYRSTSSGSYGSAITGWLYNQY